ncbi:hypothetical protein [Streptomyces sp. NPDC001717]|uniref:hypothetical protein n=1 Tax=Streptomyces sp. NPDC001717 TaxID=3364604 RepID=UPI0036AC21A4
MTPQWTAADPRRGQAAERLNSIIARIWQLVVDTVDDTAEHRPLPPGGVSDHRDEILFMDTDHAIVQTYQLPTADGVILRRAFVGVMSSATELGCLNPYARFTDAVARTFICLPEG